jgi:hypothetical protein
MKATKVTFGRTVSKDYQSRHVSVELEIDEGEKVENALAVAKAIVGRALGETPSPGDIAKAREVIAAANLQDQIAKL